MTADFDRHASTYRQDVDRSIRFSGRDTDFFARRKADELVALVTDHLGRPADQRALDVGCGTGITDRHLARRFAELHGVDLSAASLHEAQVANPSVTYHHQTGDHLPLPDDGFDLAFAVCVLHHVDPPHRERFVADVARVVRPGGLVVVFEHNPYNPLTRLAVDRCELDEGVTLAPRREVVDLLVGGGLDVVHHGHLLFTPFDTAWARRLDRGLRRLPLGGQHVTAARRRA